MFHYPDFPRQAPMITTLSVGKVGETTTLCDLDVIDHNGPLLRGEWEVGTRPNNYRAKGCTADDLSEGEYEIAVFALMSYQMLRLRVGADGKAVLVPWE